MKNKLPINDQTVKDLNVLHELAERYAGCRAVFEIWDRICKAIVEDKEPEILSA